MGFDMVFCGPVIGLKATELEILKIEHPLAGDVPRRVERLVRALQDLLLDETPSCHRLLPGCFMTWTRTIPVWI
jgi:hypothetical protein